MISDSARFHIWLGVGAVTLVAGLSVGVLSALPPPVTALEEPSYCAGAPAELPLSGKAAYAEDIAMRKVLYAENANAQLPLASLTKVMTVVTASKRLPKDATAVVTKASLAPEGDAGLYENEKWNVQDLADFTLMTSANDGAHTLALSAAEAAGRDTGWFVSEMNAEAEAIGLTETYFLNDTGLDISSTTAGAYGSARDVAHLMRYVVENAPRVVEGSAYGSRIFVSASDKKHEAKNTTAVAAAIDGLVASKTGFTDLAGGNLVAVFEPLPGRPIVAAILGGERDERDRDMTLLANAAVKELKRRILCERFHDGN
ncbi:MAG: serine hydrolase [Patescibacteria group bacterium]